MTLIGLTGYAQHGKDTVAAVLVEDFGYTRVAFADALKQLAYIMDPNIPGHGRLQSLVDQQGWEEAKLLPEVRRILQELGTGARKVIGTQVWVQAAEKAVLEAGRNVVLSDVRFPNEADFIARHNGELWRIVRVNEDGTPYDNGIGTSHPSEAFVAELNPRRMLVAANVEQLQEVVRDIVGVPVWASND